MFRIHLFVWVAVFAPVVANAQDKADVPSGKAVLDRVIAERAALRSGRIRVHMEVIVDKSAHANKGVQSDYYIVFSGQNRRIDAVYSAITPDGKRGASDSQAIIRADGSYILRPEEDDHFVDINTIREQRGPIEHRDLDPRTIGLLPNQIRVLWRYGPEDILRFFGDTKTIEVKRIVREKRSLLQLTATWMSLDKKAVRSVLVVDPEKRYSVVRIRVERPDFQYSTEVENKKWAAGVWYPERVRYRHSFTKFGIAYEEVVTVTSAEFGGTIPAREFSLDAIVLVPGRKVRKHWKHYIWDGTKLIVDPENNP